MRREARPRIAVAAGCLVNAAGEVLIAQRPEGKIAAGQWEFPGGKIEPGESAREALARELNEELGVAVREAQPLIRIVHDYSDRTVELDCWRVTAWDGAPQSRERQAFAWVSPARIDEYPILAADGPIIAALRLPAHYVFTPPQISVTALLAGLPALPRGALLRLRLPTLTDAAYRAVAAEVVAAAVAPALRVIVDRDPALVGQVGAAGWHANAAALAAVSARPAGLPLCFASAHTLDELRRAAALGFDAAVLGTVRPSASHPGEPGLGTARAAAWTQQAGLPVYWLGGMVPADVDETRRHYAQGVAAIRAYWR
ncbi:MAG: Nudix family hydrolase [Solimonas sp.]